MKRLGRLVVLVLSVVAFATGFYLIAANRDPVSLDLLFWEAVPARTGLALVLAFAAGALSGLLVGMLAAGSRSLFPRRPAGPP